MRPVKFGPCVLALVGLAGTVVPSAQARTHERDGYSRQSVSDVGGEIALVRPPRSRPADLRARCAGDVELVVARGNE
jgi:hypothetical protein